MNTPAPQVQRSIGNRDFLNATASRAIGLLRLLAIAATSDESRHGPPSLQEIDAIRALASDAGQNLSIAVEGVNERRGA